MLEVEIQNFQSIASESVKIDGFTALVGRSNIGKSAVARAIKAALTGAPVDTFVRHSPASCDRLIKGNQKCKCFCSVHIKAEGFDLLWQKGDTVNQYEFNKETFTVVGRGTPEFLEEGFGLVKIGDSKELIQVSDQFDPIFLLNQGGTVIADVLSDVARLDQINTAMALVERDRREASSTRKTREQDVIKLKRRITDFEGLDDATAQVAAVEKQERAAQAIHAKAVQLAQFYEVVLALARRVKELDSISSIEVPAKTDIDSKGQVFAQLVEYQKMVLGRGGAVERLVGVEGIELPMLDTLQTSNRSHLVLSRWVLKLRSFKDIFSQWKDVENVPVPALGALEQSSEASTLMNSLLAQHTECEGRIQTLEADLEAVQQEEDEIKAETDALGVCPTCLQPISESHVHASA